MLSLLAAPLAAAAITATCWSSEEQRFHELVQEHFRCATVCWKQKRIPSPGLMRNETIGFIEAQERFWPYRPEYRVRLMAFMLSEGGGLPDGNPDDPSHGCMHVHEPSGRYAADYYGLVIPRNRTAFTDRLGNDSRFCILVAAAELAWKEAQTQDWYRSVAQVKFGTRRYGQIMETWKDRPVALLPPVKHYVEVLGWLQCLESYRKLGMPMPECACLPHD